MSRRRWGSDQPHALELFRKGLREAPQKTCRERFLEDTARSFRGKTYPRKQPHFPQPKSARRSVWSACRTFVSSETDSTFPIRQSRKPTLFSRHVSDGRNLSRPRTGAGRVHHRHVPGGRRVILPPVRRASTFDVRGLPRQEIRFPMLLGRYCCLRHGAIDVAANSNIAELANANVMEFGCAPVPGCK